jgi:hypothetical protein
MAIRPRGFEQSALVASKTPICSKPGTESGTLADDLARSDPDLACLIASRPNLAQVMAAWPHLPEPVRQAIETLVRTSTGQAHQTVDADLLTKLWPKLPGHIQQTILTLINSATVAYVGSTTEDRHHSGGHNANH